MPKLFYPKQYSFSTKVFLSLIFFIFFFLFIKYALEIPKIKEKNYNREIENIQRSLIFVKEQMKMTAKVKKAQTIQELNFIKEKIASKVKDIKLKSKNLSNKELIQTLNKSYISQFCGYMIKSENIEYKRVKGKDLFRKNNPKILDKWQVFEKKVLNNIVLRKKVYLFYNSKLDLNRHLVLGCHIRLFNPSHRAFEKTLSVHIEKNLSLLANTITSKTAMVWINPNLKNEDNRALYEKDEKFKKKRYKLSEYSNTKTLQTGALSVKEILAARDKAPLKYKLNNEDVISWIVDLSDLDKPNNLYILIYTVKKKDIIKKSNSNLFVLLPETLLAILIAFIFFVFIFKRLFKKINIVTQTARKVNQGNNKIRTKIKGNDDIGQLGVTFDSMLDFFENSIKILDFKVEEKTKELKSSLDEKEVLLHEKETLLKEIHHRVKNNLAKTITLIELQENDIRDIKTKKALIDIKERIYTMELLHRKLYESSNLDEIPLKEYLIDLIEAIARAYKVENKVQIDYEIELINLNIEMAMHFGLIINELLTNSIKYAFLDEKKGKIYLKIYKDKNILTMIFKDNGKGIKKETLENNSTLGLKLINTLVRFQLLGELNYIYENGAKFTITATIKDKKNSIIL